MSRQHLAELLEPEVQAARGLLGRDVSRVDTESDLRCIGCWVPSWPFDNSGAEPKSQTENSLSPQPTGDRPLCEKYFQAQSATPALQPEQRIDLFARAVEPTLQRELKHKGSANGNGSYSAELIGYVEIIDGT